jgi:hypothetical protein
MTVDETRDLMKRLARYVFDHHLKKNDGSEQRGMIYEYFDTSREGAFDRFVQGEALDTMHDGAWFTAALVNAARATGDPFYRRFLTEWTLPFYCRVLNHSDTLFHAKRNDVRPGGHAFGKAHRLIEGEKGFCPYWWDDGNSVSLERRAKKEPRGPFPCVDRLAGKPNPQFRLDGWSLGCSNHMAQDLAVMLQQAWLCLRAATDEEGRALAAEVAEAAKHLHASRMRHHGPIPMCVAPAALAHGDAALLKRLPDPAASARWKPDNPYVRVLYDFTPGRTSRLPGFADNQQYYYYTGIARAGGTLPKPLAFRVVYDAYTAPLLYRYYCDDEAPPPGVNVFDLHGFPTVGGRLADYRSDRKGPSRKPRPIGSRMGPQNMICTGWACQALAAQPGLWEERYRMQFKDDLRVYLIDPPPGSGIEPPPAAEAALGLVTARLSSDRLALRIEGASTAAEAAVRFHRFPDAKGGWAELAMKRAGSATVLNDQGEALTAEVTVTPAGAGFVFKARIPYMVAKGQKDWANGIEHGRYTIRVGDVQRNVYLASPEAQVVARLRYELGCGLRTWDGIFRKMGFIPTGINAGGHWGPFSDSGGYAHLLSAASQWLYVLEGKRDWEMQGIPKAE